MQAKLRNFYDDFGERIRFIREKRGLTLSEVGGGKPSTAKSWESGSRPGPDLWETIARRLGLSVSFVFLGHPQLREDYDFVAKYADELPRQASDSGGPISPPRPLDMAADQNTTAAIRAYLDGLIIQAGGDPHRLSWLLEQLRGHVRVPEHWAEKTQGTELHHQVIAEVLEKERREEARAARRKAHSRSPRAQGGAGR